MNFLVFSTTLGRILCIAFTGRHDSVFVLMGGIALDLKVGRNHLMFIFVHRIASHTFFVLRLIFYFYLFSTVTNPLTIPKLYDYLR